MTPEPVFTKMKEADLVESGEFDLTNNTYGNFCLKWSAEEFELWKMITVCISSVGLLACVLAIHDLHPCFKRV